MSKLIKLRTFLDLHALYMHSWSTSNACSAERCFLAPKWLAGNRPKVSATYDTRSATTDSNIFPSVASSDIGLQAFAVVSLAAGILPTQWRHARIIPLKKPEKGNCGRRQATGQGQVA